MKCLLLISITLFLSVDSIAQTSDCNLKKDKNGVKVYTCKSDTSEFKSIKAEFVIDNISIEELKTFLFTVPNYLNWQYNAMEASMVKKISADEMIYRVVIDAPWPLDNREMIVQFSSVIHDADHANFYINTVATDLPKQDDLVRVPYSQASWTIVRINGALHITYKMKIDPGGHVPMRLVNIAMAEGPHQSFRNLKKLLKKK